METLSSLKVLAHVDSDFRPDLSDEPERWVEDLGPDLDVFGQRHRTKLGLVEVGVQPGRQQTQVGQSGRHADDLNVEPAIGPFNHELLWELVVFPYIALYIRVHLTDGTAKIYFLPLCILTRYKGN